MFNLPENKKCSVDLPLIERDEAILLFDEVPILFTGISKYNSHIIGISIDEDTEAGLEWYFHLVVTDEDYFSYTHRQVSYLSLLERASVLYVIEKDVRGDRDVTVYQIAFEDVPEDYRPLPSSFFPIFRFRPSFAYETRLKGKLADDHLAVPVEVNRTQISVAALIDNAVGWLEGLFGLKAEVFLKPATQSSYAISYEIQLKQFNLFVEEAKCREYLKHYIEYCLEHLPTDLQQLAEVKFDQIRRFNELFELSRSVGVSTPLEGAEETQAKQEFAFSLLNAASVMRVLSEDVGCNYSSIEFASVGSMGVTTSKVGYPLGSVNSSYKERLAAVSELIDDQLRILDQTRTVEDAVPAWFDVSVYEFNRTTGNGWALVYNRVADAHDKARIAFAQYPYKDQSSKYTGSLHSGRKLKVLARASRKANGSIAKLEIISE